MLSMQCCCRRLNALTPGTDAQISAVRRVDKADYWDGPSSKMVRAFGMIASVIAGRPVALGEHGSHTALSAPTRAAAPAPQP